MRVILPILLFACIGSAQPADLAEIHAVLPLVEERGVGDEAVILATGGCSIRGPGFEIRGDHLVLWCDPVIRKLGFLPGGGGSDDEETPDPKTAQDWLGPIIHAVYASGNVRYERTTPMLTFESEKLFVDFRKHKALFLKARVQGFVTTDPRGQPVPMILRAEKVRQIAEGEFRASSASITTCDLEEPHYEVEVDDVEARFEEGRWDVVTDGGTIRAGAIPIFWLPYLALRTDVSLRPFRSARVGASSRLGTEIETLWGDDIEVGGEKWGEWFGAVDWRSRRGIGLGLDLDYATDLYQGVLRTYYQRDDKTNDVTSDEPVPKEDRGRIWLQHRFELGDGNRLDLETHLVSDDAYRLEFWTREKREEKDPETYAQFRKLEDNLALFGLVRYRANDFQTQTDDYPMLSGTLIGQPVAEEFLGVDGWRILLSSNASFSQVRRREADRTGGAPEVARGDWSLAAKSPFGIGPVRFAPVVGVRGTVFSEDVEGDSTGRFAAEAGFRVDLTLRRTFADAVSESLQIHGLRHVMHLDLEYLSRFTVTVDPDELIFHDAMEELRETEVVRLRWRNRFQTPRGRSRKSVDIVDLEFEAEFYPEREIVRDRSVQGLAFLEARLESPIREDLTLRMDLDYDVENHDWMTASTGLRYRPAAEWSSYLGHRYIGGEQNLVSAWLESRPTSRYGFRGYARYDFKRDRWNRAGILIRRYAHDWVLETDFRVSKDLDEFAFSISILPRGFEKGPTAARERLDDRILYGEGPR